MTPSPDAPLVSVVTPSLDQGRFLGQAIDSVLARDYPRVEYLVIDGGSSDETLQVLRSYGERVAFRPRHDRRRLAVRCAGLRPASAAGVEAARSTP